MRNALFICLLAIFSHNCYAQDLPEGSFEFSNYKKFAEVNGYIYGNLLKKSSASLMVKVHQNDGNTYLNLNDKSKGLEKHYQIIKIKSFKGEEDEIDYFLDTLNEEVVFILAFKGDKIVEFTYCLDNETLVYFP